MEPPLGSDGPGKSAVALLHRVSPFLGVEESASTGKSTGDRKITEPAGKALQPVLGRIQKRITSENVRRQENIESITNMAFSLVTSEASPDRMENDWLSYFYDGACIISDRNMQRTWAKVLAGEANSPGSFSRRVITALLSIDETDLEMLTNARRACIEFDKIVLFVYELNGKIYHDNGISFSTLLHLDEIGLANFTDISEHSSITTEGLKGCVDYFDEQISIQLGPNQELYTGLVTLTKTGEELIRTCDATPIKGFSSYIRRMWQSLGVGVVFLKQCG